MNVKTNCLSKSILNGKGYCFILIALLLCIGTISALGENDSTQLPASALGAIQSEGNWTYAVRESDEYAVITGYTGSESSICVPEQICGYEVAGIASGALTNPGIQEVVLNVNIVSIAENAFGAVQPIIAAPHGCYAQRWCTENNYSFRNTSLYEFKEKTVDLSNAPSGHLLRHGYTLVEIHPLQAMQLSIGDYFWMLDENNIDFHFRVLDIHPSVNDLVSVSVDVPPLGEVVRNQRLSKTVSMTGSGVKAQNNAPASFRSGSYAGPVTVDSDPISFDLGSCSIKYLSGDHSSISEKISGKVNMSIQESYVYGMDGEDLDYLEMTEIFQGTIEFSLKIGASGGEMNTPEELAEPVTAEIKPPFSFSPLETGIFSIDVTPSVEFSITGTIKGTCTFYAYQRKEYDFTSEQWITKDTWSIAQPGRNSCSLEGSIEAKLGVKVTVDATFFHLVKAVTLELEAGIKATAGVNNIHFGGGALFSGDPCLVIEVFGYAKIKVKVLGFTIIEPEFTTKDWDNPVVLAFHISPQYGVHWPEDCPMSNLISISYDTRTAQRYEWVYIEPGQSLGAEYNYTPDSTFTSGAFLGWADNPNSNMSNVTFGDDGTKFSNSTTLYAVWENTVEVTFDSAVDGLVVPSQYVPVDGYAAEPDEPEQPGNLFRHWCVYSENDSVQWRFDSDRVPAGGLVLHALWYGDTEYSGGTLSTAYIGFQYDMDPAGFSSGEYSYTVLHEVDGVPLLVQLNSCTSDYPYISVPQTYSVNYYKDGEMYTTNAVVAGISSGAFSGCSNLRMVYFQFNGTVDLTNMFRSCSNLVYADLSRIQLKDQEIGTCAFQGCSALQGVKIGRGLKGIAEYAFDGARLQCTFDLPDGITYMDEYAFANTKIASVTVPKGITSVSDYLFYKSDLYMVTFPEHLESIGNCAFSGCSNLSFADLPDRLISIGDYAFAETAIRRVELPDSVISINGSAYKKGHVEYLKWTAGIPVIPWREFNNDYYGNSYASLKELIIPEGVTAIEDSSNHNYGGAFSRTPLERITLPSTLTRIGSYAFRDCQSLTEISFPNGYGLHSVGTYAFNNCSSLVNLPMESGLEVIEEGVFAGTAATEVILPDSVTEVHGTSFKSAPVERFKWTAGIPVIPWNEFNNDYYGNGYASLKELIIPEGVTAIEDSNNHNYGGAFSGTPLESITLPSTLTRIGSYAFRDCQSLTEISFPNGYGLHSVGTYAFNNCTSLENLPMESGLEVIEEGAFAGTAATEVILPDSVTEVHGTSFKSAPVERFKWTAGIPVIPWREFNNDYYGNGYASLKELIIPEGVTAIEDSGNHNYGGAFSGTPLERITLPSTLTRIGSYAFRDCQFLTEISFPNGYGLHSVGTYAFNNCSSLVNLPMESGLEVIEEGAFASTAATEVNLPDTVTEVHGNSFNQEVVEKLKWTAGIPVIPWSEFNNDYYGNGYASLKELIIPEGVTAIEDSNNHNYGGAFSKTPLERIILPSTLTRIGSYAFRDCQSLTEISFPNGYGLHSVGTNAFNNCSSLVNLPLESGLEMIEEGALAGTAATEVNLPDTVTEVHGNSFNQAAVEKLKWTAGIPVIPWDEFKNENSSNHYTVLKELIIPEGVTAIENSSNHNYGGAFSGTPLERITLPSTLTRIGSYAFRDCQSLTEISFPNGYGLNSIGTNAFNNCSSLVNLPMESGLEVIEEGAFAGTAATEVILPDSVTEVHGTSFKSASVERLKWTAGIPVIPWREFNNDYYGNGYASLKELIIPEGVTAIEDSGNHNYGGAFSKTPLESITIPFTLLKIGSYAFNGCTALKEIHYWGTPTLRSLITVGSNNDSVFREIWDYLYSECILPSGLTLIQSEAFEHIASEVVVVPANVEQIEERAFAGCSALRALVLLSGETELSPDILAESNLSVIYCLKGSNVAEWCKLHGIPMIEY